MPTIDLNADLGEGCGADEDLLRLVSSASIACGAHAGDALTMRHAIHAALHEDVSVGAHPGYPDRAGFGRRETGATPDEIRETVFTQLDAFAVACLDIGASFRHVKPHGAMYNRATVETAAAESVARAVAEFDRSLIVLCMPGSRLMHASAAAGLATAAEAFIDRAYQTATTLVARTAPGAMITIPAVAAARAEHMALEYEVESIDGSRHAVHAASLCVHGDNPDAVALMRAARSRLEERGVVIAPFHA
ncbi:MAG: 5-oxoprolinase subunit PxpA [Gemmatimonadaceae bacterium]